MGARGFNIVQEGHVVSVLSPGSISGGVSGQIFSMKRAAKCNISLSWGALAAGQGAVTLSACTDLAGDNATPLAFDLYQQIGSGPGGDVYQPRQSISTMGYTPFIPATVDILEIQADQMPDGFSYLKLSIADGTNADAVSAVALLTGYRYQGDGTVSATI